MASALLQLLWKAQVALAYRRKLMSVILDGLDQLTDLSALFVRGLARERVALAIDQTSFALYWLNFPV